MYFNSFEFVLFFAIVYGLYVVLRHRQQNYLLLVASYFFYGWWDWRFLSLIVLSTLVDYSVGLALDSSSGKRRRRQLVWLSVGVNLGVLGIFKYFGFFAESLNVALAQFGIAMDARMADLVLPVGISFYTFQTMSYTIDIYYGKMKPTRSLLNFAVFVAYFPQLVAGPIERASHLLPQVEKPRSINYEMIREGLWLVLLGYFKKVVIADNMAEFTKPIFENPEAANGLLIVAGIYAFAFQIYGDFSGYSDIARGISKLMGFDIMVNFRMPYFATNPREFWQRWHISLSTWLRDYLYIPLGGSRGGTRQTYRNLMITMTLGGLWHGAAWNFVAWGVYQGSILCVHRYFAGDVHKPSGHKTWSARLSHAALVVLFFQVTCFGWLLFAVKDLRDVPLLLRNIFNPFELNFEMAALSIVFFVAPLFVLDWYQERSRDMLVVKTWRPTVRLAVYATLFAYILLCGVPAGQEFIYFQF